MVRIYIEDEDGVRFTRDVEDKDFKESIDEIIFKNGHDVLMTEPI
jgi:hypothetical protein